MWPKHVANFVCVSAQAQACGFSRVALLIQHAMRMNHIACGVSDSTMFFGFISETARFSREKNVTDYKMCDFLYKFIWNISRSMKHSARYYYKRENVFM